MLDLIKQLSPGQWSAIFSAISTIVVIIGVVLGLVNLRIITRTHQLSAVKQFIEDLEHTANDRKFVYRLQASEDLRTLSLEDEQRIHNVINFLNRLGLLLENRLLSTSLVLSICHTVIIRCCYKLESFAKMHEERIGGRYGRRLVRLAKKAQDYHDIRPQHRATRIFIYEGKENERKIIYETERKGGFAGARQRLVWFSRDLLRIY